jgi:capsular polysaccharide biosynthesis protein
MYGVEEELHRQGTQQDNANGAAATIQVTPYVGVLTAARRHPLLALLPIVILVAAGVGIGLQRSPNYTATTHLQVGGINLDSPGALTGYSTATAALASAYARAVYANDVIVPVARRYHLSPQALRSRISATPIPQSPLFTVSVKDSRPRGAVALSNAVSRSLRAYIDRSSRGGRALTRITGDYKSISSDFNGAQIRANTAQQKYLRSQSSANFNALRDARTAASVAQLEASAVQSAYQDVAQRQQSNVTASVLDSATGASSDRTSRLELLAFIGLLAGLAIGLALATARANRNARRVVEA